MSAAIFTNDDETTEPLFQINPPAIGLLLLIRRFLQSDEHEGLARLLTHEAAKRKERPLAELCSLVAKLYNGLRVVRTLCDDLDNIKSVDDLVGLFSETMKLVHPDDQLEALVDPVSVFGLFLRRCLLSFLSLPFEGISRLFTNLVRYRSVTSEVTEPAIDEVSVSGPGSTAILTKASDRFDAFVTSLAETDVLAAPAYLHRYFDLLPIAHDANSATRHNHHASLNSASMLIKLGFLDEAQMSVAETIRAAQQVQDTETLTHALILLAHILRVSSSPIARQQEAHVLWRCVKLGMQHNLSHLTAVALLSTARLAIEWTGRPERHQSPALEAHTAITLAERIITRDGLDYLVGPCSLMMASSMAHWGHSDMAAVYAEAFIARSQSMNVTCDDKYAAMNLLALCSSTAGRHGDAVQYLKDSKQHCGLDWCRAAAVVLHRRAMAHGNHWLASRLAMQLCLLSSDNNLAAEALLRHTETQRATGHHLEAVALSHYLCTKCSDEGNIQKSLAHLMSIVDSHIMTESFEAALIPTLRCVSLADQCGFDSQKALSRVLLSEVQCGLGVVKLARDGCVEALPQVVQHCSPQIVGRAHLCIAKCALAIGRSNRQLNEALQSLVRSLDSYTAADCLIEAANVCYIQARILDDLGRVVARNTAAKKFRQFMERVGGDESDDFALLDVSIL